MNFSAYKGPDGLFVQYLFERKGLCLSLFITQHMLAVAGFTFSAATHSLPFLGYNFHLRPNNGPKRAEKAPISSRQYEAKQILASLLSYIRKASLLCQSNHNFRIFTLLWQVKIIALISTAPQKNFINVRRCYQYSMLFCCCSM